MPHIGVKRFATGHGEHDRAQQNEPRSRIGDNQMQPVEGVKRRDDRRIAGDLEQAEQADRGEPNGHDRPEETANPAGAAPLYDEQDNQQRDG